jgi:hypothetical protein
MTGRSSNEELRTIRLWDKTNFLSSTLNTCSEFFLPKNLALPPAERLLALDPDFNCGEAKEEKKW